MVKIIRSPDLLIIQLMLANTNIPDTKYALHRLSPPLGPSGPQSALLMAWSHNPLRFWQTDEILSGY